MYLFIVHPFLLQGPATGSSGGGPEPFQGPVPATLEAPGMPGVDPLALSPGLPSGCGIGTVVLMG